MVSLVKFIGRIYQTYYKISSVKITFKELKYYKGKDDLFFLTWTGLITMTHLIKTLKKDDKEMRLKSFNKIALCYHLCFFVF